MIVAVGSESFLAAKTSAGKAAAESPSATRHADDLRQNKQVRIIWATS